MKSRPWAANWTVFAQQKVNFPLKKSDTRMETVNNAEL
jgi:hypothetical protein